MNHRINGHARVALAMALAGLPLCAGCGEAPTVESGETAAAELDLITCTAGDNARLPEFYVLSAINDKLAFYPELAERAGLERAGSCDEARTFWDAYLEHGRAVPGFDLDQPLVERAELPAPPDVPEPELEVAKVRGGSVAPWAYPQVAIVSLRWNKPFNPDAPPSSGPPNDSCTGYFITKNWLVTSAHCLPATTSQAPDDRKKWTAQHLEGYAPVEWEVRWPDATGKLGDAVPTRLLTRTRARTVTQDGRRRRVIEGDVLQIPHPQFMGWDDSARDFALIYFRPDRYDRFLPPRPDQGAALRLATRPLDSTRTVQASFAGYGPPQGLLRVGRAPITFEPTSGFYSSVVQFPPPREGLDAGPNEQAAMCQGDSGGPLFQTFDFHDLEGQVVPNVPIAFGTNQSVSRVDTEFCAPFDAAQPAAQLFARNDTQLAFIRSVVRPVDNGHCTELPIPPATDASFAQCWGKPCQRQADCARSEVCRHAGSTLKGSCEACGAGQGCGCIWGQCLPKRP